MPSEPKRLSAFPNMARLTEALAARKAWEAENPKLAAEWSEAMKMDAVFDAQRELHEYRKALASDVVNQLRKLGVPERAAFALRALQGDRTGPRYVGEWFDAPAGQPKPFLVLLGKPGCGKTVAAAYACQLQLGRTLPNSQATSAVPREQCMWVASADLAILSSFDEADRLWFERMQHAPFLVLDDFGAEQLHPQAQQRLERLIDARYAASRMTLITSNAGEAELKARVGTRIEDRLREAGRVVNCGNQSLRGKP